MLGSLGLHLSRCRGEGGEHKRVSIHLRLKRGKRDQERKKIANARFKSRGARRFCGELPIHL